MANHLDTPFLQLRGISKSFGGVKALEDIHFSVRRGEVVALVGDNGAGKSTLFKVISGVLEPDGGQYLVEGQEVLPKSVLDANNHGIQTVYQDLALCDNLDTVANLYLGSEIRRPWWLGFRTNRPLMEHTANGLLRSMGVKVKSLSVPVGQLSGGQRQSVAIVRSVLRDPKLVLLDEPTAALGVEQTRQVLDLIHRLREEGRGVAIVSHNLGDVLEVADRIVVLRLGKIVGSFDAKETDADMLVAAITGITGASAARERNSFAAGGDVR